MRIVGKYCEVEGNKGDCVEHLIDGDVTKIEMFSDLKVEELDRDHLKATEKVERLVPAGFRITKDAG